MSTVRSEGRRLCACVRVGLVVSGEMRWLEGERERETKTHAVRAPEHRRQLATRGIAWIGRWSAVVLYSNKVGSRAQG